ncbi:MAG: hypothetical protein Q7T79_01655 [bacterium]|nr:hypothetical protein [bacterium]
MIQIKIIDVPLGQAPDWVRKEWVGLILPVAENLPPLTFLIGALDGEVKNPSGYAVETTTAIKTLAIKSPEAAKWWEDNISSDLMPWMFFHEKVCRLI